jgi:hypothetical protein
MVCWSVSRGYLTPGGLTTGCHGLRGYAPVEEILTWKSGIGSAGAHPDVTVEIGEQTSQAIAQPVTGEERDQIYARWAERYPQFREYQEKTSRIIPVIELELQSA